MNYSKNSDYWKKTGEKQKIAGKSLTHSDSFLPLLERESILNFLNPNDNVLEIGCGACDNSIYFMEACNKYHGIDLTEDFIELGQEKISKKNLSNSSLEVYDGYEFVRKNKITQNVIITQRFVINLLNKEIQLSFFENIKKNRTGNLKLLICEGFSEELRNLNALRTNLDLPEIKVAEYNNFLDSSIVDGLIEMGYKLANEITFDNYFFVTRLISHESLETEKIQEIGYKMQNTLANFPAENVSYSKLLVFEI